MLTAFWSTTMPMRAVTSSTVTSIVTAGDRTKPAASNQRREGPDDEPVHAEAEVHISHSGLGDESRATGRPGNGLEQDGHTLSTQTTSGDRGSRGALDHLKTEHLDRKPLERKVGAAEAAEAKQGAHEPVTGNGEGEHAFERHFGRYVQRDLMDLVHIELREVTIEGSHTKNLRGSSEEQVARSESRARGAAHSILEVPICVVGGRCVRNGIKR